MCSPLSKTSPGSKAAVALTAPQPTSNGDADPDGDDDGFADGCSARIGLFQKSMLLAVVRSAEWMAEGLQVGFLCLMRATMPAMCGVAMLVPDISANFSPAKSVSHTKSSNFAKSNSGCVFKLHTNHRCSLHFLVLFLRIRRDEGKGALMTPTTTTTLTCPTKVCECYAGFFHDLQLLQDRFTPRNWCCISKFIMKH